MIQDSKLNVQIIQTSAGRIARSQNVTSSTSVISPTAVHSGQWLHENEATNISPTILYSAMESEVEQGSRIPFWKRISSESEPVLMIYRPNHRRVSMKSADYWYLCSDRAHRQTDRQTDELHWRSWTSLDSLRPALPVSHRPRPCHRVIAACLRRACTTWHSTGTGTPLLLGLGSAYVWYA